MTSNLMIIIFLTRFAQVCHFGVKGGGEELVQIKGKFIMSVLIPVLSTEWWRGESSEE